MSLLRVYGGSSKGERAHVLAFVGPAYMRKPVWPHLFSHGQSPWLHCDVNCAVKWIILVLVFQFLLCSRFLTEYFPSHPNTSWLYIFRTGSNAYIHQILLGLVLIFKRSPSAAPVPRPRLYMRCPIASKTRSPSRVYNQLSSSTAQDKCEYKYRYNYRPQFWGL